MSSLMAKLRWEELRLPTLSLSSLQSHLMTSSYTPCVHFSTCYSLLRLLGLIYSYSHTQSTKVAWPRPPEAVCNPMGLPLSSLWGTALAPTHWEILLWFQKAPVLGP